MSTNSPYEIPNGVIVSYWKNQKEYFSKLKWAQLSLGIFPKAVRVNSEESYSKYPVKESGKSYSKGIGERIQGRLFRGN